MPKSQQTEEVRILHFFEEAPLEKAELLHNIVKEKMRSRMGADGKANGSQKGKGSTWSVIRNRKNIESRVSNEAPSHEKA